jgi:glycosyltransferase involved in cell wall biosynthesis
LALSLLGVDSPHEFVFYTHSGAFHSLAQQRRKRLGVRVKELFYLRRPSRLNWVLDQLFLPTRLASDELDLFQATELTSIPRAEHTNVWAVVHDLIPYLFWKEMRPGWPWDFTQALHLARRRLNTTPHLVTSSQHSKQDICRLVQIPENRVHVVYPGCNPELRPVDRLQARRRLQDTYGIDGDFLFYVGGSDFRKNLAMLINAFSLIKRDGYQGSLVLGGETFSRELQEVSRLRQQVHRYGLEGTVHFGRYIPDQDLSCFYSACQYFVFPSLYEGFGLPALEAMKCGAAILASRSSSIPEVTGDYAFYFDPHEPESLFAVFQAAQGKPERVEAHRRLGCQRADEFSWSRAARRLLALYESEGGAE